MELTTKGHEALCAETDADAFFSIDPVTTRMAVNVCGPCPLLDTCRAYALEHDVQGVWGGTTYAARNRYRELRGLVPTPVSADSFIQVTT